MSDPKDIHNESGPKDGMSEDHWRNYIEEHTAPNQNPGINEGRDLGVGKIENAPTISKEETLKSGEETIQRILEKGKQLDSKLVEKETPTQKWTERHPSKKELSNPEKINEPTETNAAEPIEPASSNSERDLTSNINDSTNLNKLQEPQKVSEERPSNSKLQGFIKDAQTFVKDYVVPVAKTGGGLVTAGKILFEPSDTVDEATEQQAIKDWAEKNQLEKNINTPSEEQVKEDNDFNNVQNQEVKEENFATAKEEPQPKSQVEQTSQVDYSQDKVTDQSNSLPQAPTGNDNIQLALNDLSSQPPIYDNTSTFDEISKEDFKDALNDVYSSTQEKDEIDQPDQVPQNFTENDNIQFALNDLSSQPSIDDNASSFDKIPKEDFTAALNDVNSPIQEKEDVAEISNDLNQEDFSDTLTDLNFDEHKIKDTAGIPDRDSEEGKEDVLEAMNDFSSNELVDGDTEKTEYFEVDHTATEDFAADDVANNDIGDIDIGDGEGAGDAMDIEL